MEIINGSFIFHAEYIHDLPEDLKNVFAMYAINYACYGVVPSISGLEFAYWARVKSRIDTELEIFKKRQEAGGKGGKNHKGNQYTRAKEQNPPTTPEWNEMEHHGTNQNEPEEGEGVEDTRPTCKAVYDFYMTHPEIVVKPFSFWNYQECNSWSDRNTGEKISNWRGAYINLNGNHLNQEGNENDTHDFNLLFDLEDYANYKA